MAYTCVGPVSCQLAYCPKVPRRIFDSSTTWILLQVDQHLARAGLRHIQFHHLCRHRARFIINDSLLLLWNLWDSHVVLIVVLSEEVI